MDRIKIFQIIVYLVVVAIITRLIYWQFFAKVQTWYLSQEDKIPAARGEIYASDSFPFAANQEAFLLYGKPAEIDRESEKIAQNLAPLLIPEKYATAQAALSEEEEKLKKEEIRTKTQVLTQKLSDRNLIWVQLARKVPLEIKEKISIIDYKGLGFERDEKRFYPEASMAAHLLGFVGSDKFGDDTGYFGLEGYYDRSLKGKPGRYSDIRDPLGFPILVGKYRPIDPKKGASLYLAIDRAVQFMVEDKLKKAVEKYGAKDGTVIIADPKTGKIISMATYPNYHPAFFSQFDDNLYKNPAVAFTYEPGSTFKLITISAALDLGVVKPDTRCPICSGPRRIGGFEISTWNKKYYPDSTMIEVIEHSDNVGMTYVAEKLEIDKFYEYISRFGFGKRTGIDLQEESAGFIRDKDEWKLIDLATASFGQGIAITPIQMVQAVSAIANGGKLTSPKVAVKIMTEDQEEIVKPEIERQVISPQTAAQVTEMMINAVEQGEAKVFAPKGYRIAGKTGTAQIPVAGHYDPDKTIASFIGFAPTESPRFVMLVLFTEPLSSPFGSETAAPTFFEIAKEVLNYYGIKPSKSP